MARPKNRKRRRADEAQDNRSPKRLRTGEADQGDRTAKRKRSHADESPRAAKKVKSTGDNNFTPSFWDNLSKVWLTPRALRELDRRNNARPPLGFTRPDVCSKSLAQFARHGGPDTSDLQGYPDPRMAAHNISSTSTSQSPRTQSTKATSISSKPNRSSAYDDDFEQHLIDHDIYPHLYDFPDNRQTPEPADLDETRQLLSNNRASLSPSRFTKSEFAKFQRKNNARSESKIMCDVIPIIAGDAEIPNEGQLPFTNLESLTGETTVKPVPDYFDGALPRDVDKKVRGDLSRTILPTKHADVPVVANLFLEAKGPRGGADVVKRQACHDGAYGARAMHRLQNYGKEEAAYDEKAYTYSSTYHSGTGTLQLYSHHMTAPKAPDGRPEYHMTQIKAFALTSDRETFVQGATTFRNARDLAKRHRDRFIQDTNIRASQSQAVAAQGLAESREDGDLTSDEPVDGTDYLASQDADDALQQQIAATTHYASEDGDEKIVTPQYLSAEDDLQESQESVAPGLDEPSMSFASSFTSSLASGSTKRPRQSLSPPSTSKRTFPTTS